MSYIDKDIVKDFYSTNHFIVKQSNETDVDSIITQIDGIIKSKLGITAPANPADADKNLQNIACNYFVWFASGKEGVTKESWDYQRRKTMFNYANEAIERIKRGEDKIFDKDGNQITVSNQSSAMFESTKRITGIL